MEVLASDKTGTLTLNKCAPSLTSAGTHALTVMLKDPRLWMGLMRRAFVLGLPASEIL